MRVEEGSLGETLVTLNDLTDRLVVTLRTGEYISIDPQGDNIRMSGSLREKYLEVFEDCDCGWNTDDHCDDCNCD